MSTTQSAPVLAGREDLRTIDSIIPGPRRSPEATYSPVNSAAVGGGEVGEWDLVYPEVRYAIERLGLCGLLQLDR